MHSEYMVRRYDGIGKADKYFSSVNECYVWFEKLFKRRIECDAIRLFDAVRIGEIYSVQKVKISKWHWWWDESTKEATDETIPTP